MNFKAKLTRLSGALDIRLRSQRAEADIENSDGKFLAGTMADVSTTLHSFSNSFIVPKTAVVASAEEVFVIRVVNGKAEHVGVKKGLEVDDLVEVFEHWRRTISCSRRRVTRPRKGMRFGSPYFASILLFYAVAVPIRGLKRQS